MSLKNRLSTVEVTYLTFRKISIISLPTSKPIKDKLKLSDRPNNHLRRPLMLKIQTSGGLSPTN